MDSRHRKFEKSLPKASKLEQREIFFEHRRFSNIDRGSSQIFLYFEDSPPAARQALEQQMKTRIRRLEGHELSVRSVLFKLPRMVEERWLRSPTRGSDHRSRSIGRVLRARRPTGSRQEALRSSLGVLGGGFNIRYLQRPSTRSCRK